MENDYDRFVQSKKEQCVKLIQYGIWKGVDSNDLKAWLKNFETPQEKYFAARLIDWLVYRNFDHIDAMLFDLLTRHLHNQWRLDGNPLYKNKLNPLEILCNKWGFSKYLVRYVTAVKPDDPGTKSGYRIINTLNHNLNVSDKYNIKIEDIKQAYENGVRTFLLFDDILGTGEQMKAILNLSAFSSYSDVFVYVLVCAAHEKGISEIKKEFPFVKVLYAEYIPYNSSLFNAIPAEELGLKDANEVHDWYKNFMHRKGVHGKSALGRGDLGMVYAFQNSVPNNCLPLLYYESEQLSKLLNKRG